MWIFNAFTLLFNPWGSNRHFPTTGDADFWLGKNDPDNPTHADNGYFWMDLSDFTKKFSAICYEE